MADERKELTREELNAWAEGVVSQIRFNFPIQHVSPTPVYQGYKGRQTGAAIRSIYFKISEFAEFEKARIDFFYVDYLKYVDMGVGAGFPYSRVSTRDSDIQRGERHHNWSKRGDRGERPVLKSVINYKVRVLRSLLNDRFLQHYEVFLFNELNNLTEKDIQLL